jgi:hypothetical protein
MDVILSAHAVSALPEVIEALRARAVEAAGTTAGVAAAHSATWLTGLLPRKLTARRLTSGMRIQYESAHRQPRVATLSLPGEITAAQVVWHTREGVTLRFRPGQRVQVLDPAAL